MPADKPRSTKRPKNNNSQEKPKKVRKLNGEDIIEKTLQIMKTDGEIDAFIRTDKPKYQYLDCQGIDLMIIKNDEIFPLQAKTNWKEEKMHRHFERYPKVPLMFVRIDSPEHNVKKAIKHFLTAYNNPKTKLVYRVNGEVSLGYYNLSEKTIAFHRIP